MDKEEIIKQIEINLDKLSKKDFGIYFFVADTKGAPAASIANIYEHVKMLNELGYKANILHEKNDYQNVNTWLGEDYSNLPHVSIESNELKVSGTDVVVIPEIFANILEQINSLPCRKMVISQSYDYMFEMLTPGKTWSDYKVRDVITTSENQKEYLKSVFNVPSLDIGVIDVGIPEYFTKSEKPKKPIVTIATRDPRDTVKIFKSFYVKYPHLKWITFRDLKGLPREKFAEELSESCVTVWVDEISGFGTIPLESMKCLVPVIGKVPNLVPNWMTDKNGLWTNNINNIVDILGNFLQAWLEDQEPAELYDEMSNTVKDYTLDKQKNGIKLYFENLVNKMSKEFTESLENLKNSDETELQNQFITNVKENIK